jgi:rare lipoprotein A
MGARLPSIIARAAMLGLAALVALSLGACVHDYGRMASASYRAGPMRPYDVDGRHYEPRVYDHYDETGLASWYSYPAHTRRTADGEWFDAGALTAAHKTLPLPSVVEVTNLDNGRKIRVRVNDRGPFVSGRIIDLSRAAADRLGFASQGTARVRVRLLGPAEAAEADTVQLSMADPAPIALRGPLAPDGLRGWLD